MDMPIGLSFILRLYAIAIIAIGLLMVEYLDMELNSVVLVILAFFPSYILVSKWNLGSG